MRGRGIGPWLAIGGALLLVALLVGRQQNDVLYDVESVGASGTLALVEFLEANGATVEFGLPSGDTDTTLILVDGTNGEEQEEILQWTRAGGNLVVADLGSGLSGLETFPFGLEAQFLDRGVCSIPGLDDVRRLEGSPVFLVTPFANDQTCFGDGEQAFLARSQTGDGSITVMGLPTLFTNSALGDVDNAVLAGRLLFGEDGEGVQVSVLFDPDAAQQRANEGGQSGEFTQSKTLGDLIGDNVRWGLWQLAVAGAIFVWMSARRFGGVVNEPAVVELPGSLAVRATGELRRRSGGHARAAEDLRVYTERRIRTELKLPPDLDTRAVAATAAMQTGADEATLAALLQPTSHPQNSSDLVRYVTQLDAAVAPILRRFEPVDSILDVTDPETDSAGVAERTLVQ